MDKRLLFLIILIWTLNLRGQSNSGNTVRIILSVFFDQLNADNDSLKPLKFHNGYLISTNNDTIRGLIKMTSFKVSNSITLKINSKDSIIKLKNLNKIRLFSADTIYNLSGFTDYIKIGNNQNKLYRNIYSGSFKIYDEVSFSNENLGLIGNKLVVIDNNDVKEISNIWTNNPKKNMIEYINLRFHKNFTKKDFKRKYELINWLYLNDK